jgi:multicomponent Na+:H+ antiporter subunit D
MNSIILFILIPIGVAAVMPLVAKLWRGLCDIFASLTAAVLFAFGIGIMGYVNQGGLITLNFGTVLPFSALNLRLDSFSLIMLLVISLISFFALIFSFDYINHYGYKPGFYGLFMVMIAGMNGVVLAADLFNLYLFLEVAAAASFALVAYGLRHEELEAAFKYLVLSAVATAFILLAIALIYTMTGSLTMTVVAQSLAAAGTNKALLFTVILFIVGFGLKAAMVPFHAWLPDAHPSAPAPISAMLSGVVIKVSGIYALMRIVFNVIGITPTISQTLMAFGMLSMVVGAVMASVQTDFKRLLAYSSISQIGYILLGFGLATPLGILGAIYHMMNHATFKGLLFLTAGSTEYSTGTRDLKRMGGLTQRMPVTGSSVTVGSLAIAGVPPLNGFFSKLIIIIAAIEAHYYIYAVIAVLISLVTLGYFLKVNRYAFFGKIVEEFKAIKEVPLSMAISTAVLALLCIAFGICYPILSKVILQPAANVLLSGRFF